MRLNWRRWAKFAALGCALIASACGSSRSEDLLTSARSYNEGLRWGKLTHSSAYVAAEARAEWLAQRSASMNGLNMTDVQIISIDPGSNPDELYVTVGLAYYRLPDMTSKEAVWRQQWQRKDSRWWMVKEAPVQAPADQPSWP